MYVLKLFAYVLDVQYLSFVLLENHTVCNFKYIPLYAHFNNQICLKSIHYTIELRLIFSFHSFMVNN